MWFVKYIICTIIIEMMIYLIIQFTYRNYISGMMTSDEFQKQTDVFMVAAVLAPFVMLYAVP